MPKMASGWQTLEQRRSAGAGAMQAGADKAPVHSHGHGRCEEREMDSLGTYDTDLSEDSPRSSTQDEGEHPRTALLSGCAHSLQVRPA